MFCQAERFTVEKRADRFPGPGAYAVRSSIGPQFSSAIDSAPLYGFGSAFGSAALSVGGLTGLGDFALEEPLDALGLATQVDGLLDLMPDAMSLVHSLTSMTTLHSLQVDEALDDFDGDGWSLAELAGSRTDSECIQNTVPE